MNFSWTDEQKLLRHETLQFGSELNEGLYTRDQAGQFDRALWQRCADQGLLGLCYDKAYGGTGLDVVSTIGALESFGYGCKDNGLTLGVNGQMWSIQEPLRSFGTETQNKKYMPGLIDGTLMGAHGMTEPESGSDAFSLSTTAKKVDGGYVLNGRKTYIGLAPVCDIALIFASTQPELGAWGISAFIVERAFDGFKTSMPKGKAGLRTTPLGDIELVDCFVPEENRLGDEGIGTSLFNTSMDWERSFIFASHVGSMARQLDECVAFAQERKQFDQPIGKFQSVSNRIAEMKLRLETSQLLLYKLAWLKDEDEPAGMEAAMANLQLAESFAANSLDAMRIHGARGYMAEFEVERDVRDAIGGVIYSGTSDIQRNIIARYLGL